MNDITRKNTETFIQNFITAQKLSRWDGYKTAATMAAILIGTGEPTPLEVLKEAEQTIKRNEGVFSDLRGGYSKRVVNAIVASAPDQEQAVMDLRNIIGQLKPGVFSSFQHAISACLIYMCNEDGHYEAAVDRTLRIFNEIKSNHPILGGGRELPECALIAMTDKDPGFAAEDWEECYSEIIKIYGKCSISLRTAAATSLFGGGADIRAEKVKALHQELKKERFHFVTEGVEMIALMSGVFGDQARSVIAEMKEVSSMLAGTKGFGAWGLGDKLRNLISAAIVIASLADDPKAALFAKQILITILCIYQENDDASAAYVATM